MVIDSFYSVAQEYGSVIVDIQDSNYKLYRVYGGFRNTEQHFTVDEQDQSNLLIGEYMPTTLCATRTSQRNLRHESSKRKLPRVCSLHSLVLFAHKSQ